MVTCLLSEVGGKTQKKLQNKTNPMVEGEGRFSSCFYTIFISMVTVQLRVLWLEVNNTVL